MIQLMKPSAPAHRNWAGQLELDQVGLVFYGQAADLAGRADIVRTDLLVVVDEQDGDLGSSDDIVNLILALVHVSAFLFQTMCFVDNQDFIKVFWRIPETAGTLEKIVETGAAARLLLGQMLDHDFAESGIGGDKSYVFTMLQELSEDIHRDDRFACARATFDHDDRLAGGIAGSLENGFEDDLLLIKKDELAVAIEQAGDMIHELAGMAAACRFQ